MLSRKYYIAIAKIIRDTHPEQRFIEKGELARLLANYFHEDSPFFDRDVFLKACSLGGGEK